MAFEFDGKSKVHEKSLWIYNKRDQQKINTVHIYDERISSGKLIKVLPACEAYNKRLYWVFYIFIKSSFYENFTAYFDVKFLVCESHINYFKQICGIFEISCK